MSQAIRTPDLVEALSAEGYEFPPNTATAELEMGINAPIILHIRTFVDDELLAKVGAAICRMARTKVIAPLLLFMLLASPAGAASITYEQPFAFESHVSYGAVESIGLSPAYLELAGDAWFVPAPEALPSSMLLELEVASFIDASADFVGGIMLQDPESGHPFWAEGTFAWLLPYAGPVTFSLAPHADTIAFYDASQVARFDAYLTGTARATYIYDDPALAQAAVPVPEPLSLFMLAGGLLAGWRCRR